MRTWILALLLSVLALAACGGEVVIDGGDIGGTDYPLAISNLSPADFMVTANTGTVAVPVTMNIYGIRGAAVLHLEVNIDGRSPIVQEYDLSTPIPYNLAYHARLILDTDQLVSGQSGTFAVYVVLSNPTVTSNSQSGIWRVQ